MFEIGELRERLILAGIGELEQHGMADFSLRRVANACGVSCAAPYKHFKNKDDLILEIFHFINRQWALLEQQIVDVFEHDTRKLLLEICMANIRFRLGNPHYGAVLSLDTRGMDEEQRRVVGETLSRVTVFTERLCEERGVPSVAPQKAYILRSLTYGATLMLANGEMEHTPKTLDMVRATLEWELA